MKNFYFQFVLLLVLISPSRLIAQGPYWATDVAPILYANCTKCHNPNGIAPFSLMTYNDAASMATYMRNAVSNRIMPPWPPDSSYTRFVHERILSTQEIQTIVDWVDNGVDSGNMALAPIPPTYNSLVEILYPNYTTRIPLYTVNAATDLYRCFAMPTGLTNDEYITKIEILPGDRNIVHHALLFQDVANTCVMLDNQDPLPGYTYFGGVGSSTASLLMIWVPGQGAYELPPNMGIRLQANANLILQLHYPGGTFGKVDSTEVRFTFSSGIVRDVFIRPLLRHMTSLTNGPLAIPANTTKNFHAQYTTTFDGTYISTAPHMHLIARNFISYAVDPYGDTIPLIRIPDWQFHWQGLYTYGQALHIPQGSTIHADIFYDNTSNNPFNPSSPPVNVNAGESTTDEMMLVYFSYLSYQTGDENLVFDSSVVTSTAENMHDLVRTIQLYSPYPLPAEDWVTIDYFLPESGTVTLELIDMNGQRKDVWINNKKEYAGHQRHRFDLTNLSAGNYFVVLTHNGITRTKPLIRK